MNVCYAMEDPTWDEMITEHARKACPTANFSGDVSAGCRPVSPGSVIGLQSRVPSEPAFAYSYESDAVVHATAASSPRCLACPWRARLDGDQR